jgi:N-acetylglucosamine malate deacetylase 1
MSNEPLRILAIGAHPDDIEFGCGGILLVEATRGSVISLCICSRGEAGTNGKPDEREAEARQAAKLLGATLEFVDFGGDCHFEVSPRNRIAIARQIRVARPDVLLAPTAETDQHPDHAITSRLCRDAIRLARYGGLEELRDLVPHTVRHHLEYAVTPGAEPPDERCKIVVDITAHFDRWVELMECHATQLRTRRYVELQTSRSRLLGLAAGVEHAQAVFPTSDWSIKNLSELPGSLCLF